MLFILLRSTRPSPSPAQAAAGQLSARQLDAGQTSVVRATRSSCSINSTNGAPTPTTPQGLYRPDTLPVTQPTASKH